MSTDQLLHIGFFSLQLPDSGISNGVVTYTRIMRDALRALGHSVTIVSGDQIEHHDGRIVDLPPPTGFKRRFRLLLESRRPSDGCEAWNRLRVLEAFEAACRAGVQVFEIEESFGWAGRLADYRVAIVERLHGPHVYGRDEFESPEVKKLGDLREASELASFTRVDAITCPSQLLLDAVMGRYSIDPPLARAIPNPMPVALADERWSYDGADPNQLLCVGRFDLRKGADLVLRSFARALEQAPQLKLVMAGPDFGLTRGTGTPIQFDEFIATQLAPEARARVQFLGPQPPAKIRDLRHQSAFAVVGSRFENFPYSIAEAMAVGMPVLASASFGNRELVRDGVDGRIVPVGDVEAMADAMGAMAGDPALLKRMGRSAYDRASHLLSPDRIARESVEVYLRAIEKRLASVSPLASKISSKRGKRRANHC
jgi:glycosyltransferase involved in cell wall biosynthesis